MTGFERAGIKRLSEEIAYLAHDTSSASRANQLKNFRDANPNPKKAKPARSQGDDPTR